MTEHLPHDLPLYEVSTTPRERVKVFRASPGATPSEGRWTWAHDCGPGIRSNSGWYFKGWESALSRAFGHAERCCR